MIDLTVNVIGVTIILGWLALDWRRATAWLRWVARSYLEGPPERSPPLPDQVEPEEQEAPF